MAMSSSAQNEFAKWYFGRYTGLDFMTSPPTVINHSTMSTYEGSASAADGAGNLLFYTDGITVWNKQQQVMANGTGMLGDASTVQSALIVRQPGKQNIYYVFTLAAQGGTAGLCYSLVDMSLAAGLGSVTVKNAPVFTPCTEQLTATRHCNGIDMWVVTHDFNSNGFLSFLLTSSGLNPTPVVSAIGPAPPTFTPNNTKIGQGTIKISPSGKKLGLTFFNGSDSSEVAVFDFDRGTGTVSGYLSLITGTVNYYGCEFSGDGTKFYTSSSGAGAKSVYQWDLCAGSDPLVFASKTPVGSHTVNSAGQLQLAPDGRIYVVVWGTQTMSAINNPDLAGTACNYVPIALSVASGTNGSGLPNFYGGAMKNLPQFSYTVNPVISCNTVTFSTPSYTTGCASSAYSVQSVSWNFGDPLSGAANTSTLTDPTHNYSAAGVFTAKLIFHYACGADTVYKEIGIPGPGVFVTNDHCTDSATLTVSGGTGPFTFTWFPSAQTTPVATVTTGFYTVAVTDGNNCTHSVQAQLNTFPSPTLSVKSVSICPNTAASLVASGATSYSWSPGNGSGNTFTASPASTQVYTVTGSYTTGCSSKATVTVTVLGCVSVSEVPPYDRQIKIYPNPAANIISVECPEQAVISISDMAGRLLHRQELEPGVNAVDIKLLKSGAYLLDVSGKSGQVLSRMIKVD